MGGLGRVTLSLMLDSPYKNNLARRLFDGIAHGYEVPAQIFSLFQYRRWHRFLVSRLRLSPQDLVLDVATGTGLVARDIAKGIGCRVVGLDLSDHMIGQAQRDVEAHGLAPRVSLLKGCAESLPFAGNSFDAVTFTFLYRYIDDPQDTLGELTRVLRPGGQIASLEFFIPQNPILYRLWLLHTRLVLPMGTRIISPGWREVGSFLGPSISQFYRQYTLEDLKQIWVRAGLGNVQTKVLSLGGAVVIWGQKEVNGGN